MVMLRVVEIMVRLFVKEKTGVFFFDFKILLLNSL